MRIIANILCHNNLIYLQNLIPQVAKFANRIIVVDDCSTDDTAQEDNTEEIVSLYDWPNIEFLKGEWSQDSEHLQRNMACKVLSDCDFIYLLDSDEIMTLEDQRKLLDFALSHPEYVGYAVNTIPYFYDLEHVALYDEGNTPIALIRPSARFFITRCIENPWIYCQDINIHHFKFLQPKSQIGWRVKAKHGDQVRPFRGVIPTVKNNDIESFMASCGYTDFKSELSESEIETA